MVIRWRFSDRVNTQMLAFMEGFNELVPQNMLTIFDANEVEVRITCIQNNGARSANSLYCIWISTRIYPKCYFKCDLFIIVITCRITRHWCEWLEEKFSVQRRLQSKPSGYSQLLEGKQYTTHCKTTYYSFKQFTTSTTVRYTTCTSPVNNLYYSGLGTKDFNTL